MKNRVSLSLPVIMAGIKTSTVINIGVATFAALIGTGDLENIFSEYFVQ